MHAAGVLPLYGDLAQSVLALAGQQGSSRPPDYYLARRVHGTGFGGRDTLGPPRSSPPCPLSWGTLKDGCHHERTPFRRLRIRALAASRSASTLSRSWL
jgi:hypothetical protein